MDSPLKQRLQEDMKATLRAHDKPRLDVIRMMLAAIKQIEVDERIELDDMRVCQVLNKMLKQRRDALAQYSKAKRDDLAEQERFEEAIIQTYLPESLSKEEVDRLISQAIEKVGATSVKDMGKVMAEVKLQSQGRVDIGVISAPWLKSGYLRPKVYFTAQCGCRKKTTFFCFVLVHLKTLFLPNSLHSIGLNVCHQPPFHKILLMIF